MFKRLMEQAVIFKGNKCIRMEIMISIKILTNPKNMIKIINNRNIISIMIDRISSMMADSKTTKRNEISKRSSNSNKKIQRPPHPLIKMHRMMKNLMC